MGVNKGETMPSFICTTGDVQEIALEESGVFPVRDTKGRTWYCRELKEAEMNGSIPDPVFGTMQAQQRAHKQGISQHGTLVRILQCQATELPSELIKGDNL
jgi:hypothetical protein